MTVSHVPEISVIIPVYNVEKYLRECVDSVLNQTFTDFEIILVDDESPDNCPELCEQLAEANPIISVIHKKNGGLGRARNTGIDNAQGHYVLLLDSDDCLRQDALERLIGVAVAEKADVVHGRLNRFVTPGDFDRQVTGNTSDCLVIRGEEKLRRTALCSFLNEPSEADLPFAVDGSSCGALYRRDFLNANSLRFFSERDYISEDYLFNYQCALKANCICQIPDTIYHYRVNPLSLTRTVRLDALERVANYCTAVEGIMHTDGYGEDARRYMAQYALAGIRAQCKFVLLSDLPMREKLHWARNMRNLAYFARLDEVVDQLPLSRLHRFSYMLWRTQSFRAMRWLIIAQSSVRRLRGNNL